MGTKLGATLVNGMVRNTYWTGLLRIGYRAGKIDV
jgi:hypothetical protein